MTETLFSKYSLLALIGFAVFFHLDGDIAESKRVIEQAFNAEEIDELKIQSAYGEIRFIDSDGDDIVFSITVEAASGDQNRIDRFLQSTQIDFQTRNRYLQAISEPGNPGNTPWYQFWKQDYFKHQIDYKVYVPKHLSLDLDMEHGDIFLTSKLDGLEANISYGKLNGEGTSEKVVIEGTYAEINLHSLGEADVDIEHSEMVVRDAVSLEIQSQNSEVSVDEVEYLTIYSRYDKYFLGKVNHLVNEGGYDEMIVREVDQIDMRNEYAGLTLEKCNQRFDFEVSQSDISIRNFGRDFQQGIAVGYYLDLNIHIDIPFRYNITAKHTQLNLGPIKIGEMMDNSSDSYRGETENSAKASLNLDLRHGSLNVHNAAF